MPPIERNLALISLYGAVTGLLAGLVVLAFRWLIENSQLLLLPGQVSPSDLNEYDLLIVGSPTHGGWFTEGDPGPA